ncbi:carboxypeptidase regulatory-like domain-containing protein [Streptomyces gibsoniae]|uniref:Carboxypeptidase regulatory-like domain-containing protein n=1 Tax=Streptomyces gibsoniae TaxID=3075529 RepID=A0ABU2U523_9ACTN|nr:carboxypeptidase regulatory-like domain-containing protein [Streptomyces sp. DSM 41699]MDT0468190.1 carboxypeptidase regulatory-like domain-containing protein [Streptomyces sp. DSM 41699]
MAERIERTKGRSVAVTLAEALWFPVCLFLGMLFFFAPALHAPQPHHVKVAVADRVVAERVDSALSARQPGGFDVTAVDDDQAARQSVLDRDTVAGFAGDRRHPVLYVAKANGASLEQTLTKVFTQVAAGSHRHLTVTDVAPTEAKDELGTTLLYFALAWSIPAYVLATTLLRAVTFNRRKKLLTIAGVAAVYSVIGYYAGLGLGYIPDKPVAMAVSFTLTMAVATAASGLAPFVRQFFPAVAMGLFIVMSIPTSGGAVAVSMLPTFFQHVSQVMPLANAIDALRGVFYFDGAGVLEPVLVLCVWFAAGVVLLGLDYWLRKRKAVALAVEDDETDETGETDGFDEESEIVEEPPVEDPTLEAPVPAALPVHAHHFGQPVPVLSGRVQDPEGHPVRGAAVTVVDARGRQLVRSVTNEAGEYAATGLPEGYLSIVVSAYGRHPMVHQTLLQTGVTARADFVLHGRPQGRHARPEHAAGTLS